MWVLLHPISSWRSYGRIRSWAIAPITTCARRDSSGRWGRYALSRLGRPTWGRIRTPDAVRPVQGWPSAAPHSPHGSYRDQSVGGVPGRLT